MFASAVDRRHATERAWTEHLATPEGARALLEAVGRAPLPEHLLDTLDAIVGALEAEADDRALLLTHQLHLGGRYPDVVVHDVRDQLFAVIEAQRGGADDKHIAKLAARYVPDSGCRLGILVAERWRPSSAHHPAWSACPAPVVVVLALDTLHEVDYRPVWVHRPTGFDEAA